MRWLAGAIIILAFPAQAKWRPAGGVSAIVAPHLTLPVTSLGDRAVGAAQAGILTLRFGHRGLARLLASVYRSMDYPVTRCPVAMCFPWI